MSEGQRRAIVSPEYLAGDYFVDPGRHAEDTAFKVEAFFALFDRCAARLPPIEAYADVGCGSGAAVAAVAEGLGRRGRSPKRALGYDLHPGVSALVRPGVSFVRGNFAELGEQVDLVTLFDVVEHVPDPGSFLRRVAERCTVIALHIPLDGTLDNAIRDRFRSKLSDPGHLSFWDAAGALNLLAQAGLRVLDYQYTFGFLAPSGHTTLLSKAALLVRRPLARLNPWLLSKTVGGASLMVIALTPGGLELGAEARGL